MTLTARLRDVRNYVNLAVADEIGRAAADRIEALERELLMEQRLSFRKQMHDLADKDEALMRQALEALEGLMQERSYAYQEREANRTIAALRERLNADR